MVPVVGLTAAWVLLDEALNQTQLLGAATVMAGLLINVFGTKLATGVRRIFA